MNRTARCSTALISLSIAAVLLAACSRPEPAATDTAASTQAPPAAAAPAAPASADVHAFKIGTLDATALKDGDIQVPNDNTTFGIGQPVEESSTLLSAAGAPTDMLHLSIQPLLVRTPDKVLLFDTGAAGASFAKAGRLPASLRAAGVEPANVTDIFISHGHQDHVGGLVGSDGALAFPNATIHISAAEWNTLKADKDVAKMIATITPKIATFTPGAVLVPGTVTAVDIAGHTPGHSGYDIQSGDQHLLYVGDSMHHYVLSVQRPDWTLAWDGNADQAKASRRALLQRAANENLRLYAVHFPYPGLGHVKAQGNSFVWVPES